MAYQMFKRHFFLLFIALMIISMTPGSAFAGFMFGTRIFDENLLSLNTSTGAATSIGPMGYGSVTGLAFDSNNTLFGVDRDSDQLVQINTSTGVAIEVGSQGIGIDTTAGGLAADPNANVMYYTDNNSTK